MRKTFLKVSLLGALAFSMPLAITSCKDYDDDIEVLNQETGSLKTQLSALEAALATAQADATAAGKAAAEAMTAAEVAAEKAKAAQATGDQALAEAQAAAAAAAAANAEAELAKKAAAEAKAEAIEEAQKMVNELAAKTATKEELSKLAGTVEGIQAGLNALDAEVDELAKSLTAAQTQIAALEKFQKDAETQLKDLAAKVDKLTNGLTELTTKVATLEADVKAIKDDITAIEGEIKALKAADQATESKISEINQKLATANADITKLQSQVSTLAGVLSTRLSSLDFIPESYVDGIPAIDFSALKYTAMKNTSGDKWAATGATVYTATGATAKFYVHPSTVQLKDIDANGVSVIERTATSRASNISVKNANIALSEGILSIPVEKTTTAQFKDNATTINIVSFKVPVAKVDGVTETHTVQSEFIRLAEQAPFTAEIAAVGDAANHLLSYDNVQASTPTAIVKNADNKAAQFYCKWDETLDLKTKIAGCKMVGTTHKAMSHTDLAAYGLELRFNVYKENFIDANDNNTNQQKFIQVDEKTGIVKASNDYANNQAVIGRNAIITVKLIDTKNNNNVVDVAYVAVKFTSTDLTDIVINTATTAIDLGEDWLPTTGNDAQFALTWVQVNKEIYAKYSATGISHEDFCKIYTKGVWESVSATPNTNNQAYGNKVGTISMTFDDPDHIASTNALEWVMTEDDVKTVLPDLKRTFVAKITLTNEDGLYGNCIFYVKAAVKLTLPTKGTRSHINWLNNVYRLEPVIYDSSMASGTTVYYKNDIFAGFVNNELIANMGQPVGTWDVQFTNKQPVSGYKPLATSSPAKNDGDTDGYYLYKGNGKAAEIGWNDATPNWYKPLSVITGSRKAYFRLSSSAEGQYLVENDNKTATVDNPAGRNVQLGTYVKMNKYNVHQVDVIDMKVIRPINIATTTAESFSDGIINGSEIATADLLTITDFHNYKVANEADGTYSEEKNKYTKSLWDYYGITNVQFVYDDPYLVEGGKLTTKKMKSYYPSASITPNGDPTQGTGGLIFKNPDSKVEKDFVIRIPVSVTYKYGTLESYVDVTVKVSQN